MGAIAEAFVTYAQPLLDQTDGSIEQLNKAFSISQLCHNLSILPEDGREQVLSEMRLSLDMGDEEFEDFRRSIIAPMLERHQEMFPRFEKQRSTNFSPTTPSPNAPSLRPYDRKTAPNEAYPGTDRYSPCPCNSGRKYKFCCFSKSV